MFNNIKFIQRQCCYLNFIKRETIIFKRNHVCLVSLQNCHIDDFKHRKNDCRFKNNFNYIHRLSRNLKLSQINVVHSRPYGSSGDSGNSRYVGKFENDSCESVTDDQRGRRIRKGIEARQEGNGRIEYFERIPKKFEEIKKIADPYLRLMRVNRPIGTWLLFWPGGWSILLATSPATCSLFTCLHTLGLFLAGAFVMRGAGCTINDMWDRDIDAKVERTRNRPLVTGEVSPKQALVFLAAQLSVGLSILLQLNWYSVALGASSMVLVVLYPLAKRVTHYPQLVLGLGFNWGALLGWTALMGDLDPAACIPLYLAGLSWTLLYDTIYAHQDKRDDAIIGIKSTALKFGDKTKPYLGLFATTMLGGLCAAGVATSLDWPYYAFVGAVGTHLATQIATLDTDNPSDCAEKFVSNNTVGLLIFLGILLGKWRELAQYFSAESARDKNSVADTSIPVLA